MASQAIFFVEIVYRNDGRIRHLGLSNVMQIGVNSKTLTNIALLIQSSSSERGFLSFVSTDQFLFNEGRTYY
ncbi:hypothetical protein EQP49_08125 [Yersinia sp. 2105 StPb PI]|nr:hypothetical protein EQP49_08125 [Yersinia sp. 2105 StPb PI]